MARHLKTGRVTLFRIPMLALALLTVLSSAAALPLAAQSSPGDFQLYGVNLSGTLPWMNKDGRSITDGHLTTADGKLTLSIPIGTYIRNAAAKPQEFISATLITEPPAAPSQQVLVYSYALGTPGATFSPTVGMIFAYTDAALPPSITESSLYIAEWNGADWTKLPGSLDSINNKVAVTVTNFTTYALFGSAQAPATATVPPTTQPTTTPATTTTAGSPTPTGTSSGGSGSSPVLPVILLAGGLILIVFFVAARKK